MNGGQMDRRCFIRCGVWGGLAAISGCCPIRARKEGIMADASNWSEESYDNSITSHCWKSTPLDEGWDAVRDGDLRGIFEEEVALDHIPKWAEDVALRIVGIFPPCGHYAFPQPFSELCHAMKNQQCPTFVTGCFTAPEGDRLLMWNYMQCIESWLKKTPVEKVLNQVPAGAHHKKNWEAIILATHNTLGSHTPEKELLAERLVYRLKWWVETMRSAEPNVDDRLSTLVFRLRGKDPYMGDRELPYVKELNQRITKKIADGQRILDYIEATWLCAPKVFRFLERIVVMIGRMDWKDVADISVLNCENTYPDFVSYDKWYSTFKPSLLAWHQGKMELPEAGQMTPVKHWLVRMFLYKLHFFEQYWLGKLVGTQPHGKAGTKTV